MISYFCKQDWKMFNFSFYQIVNSERFNVDLLNVIMIVKKSFLNLEVVTVV
jgi:hypothetical protein